jgi:hypothetical protein
MSDLQTIFKENPSNPGYCLVLRPMNAEFNRIWSSIKRELQKTFAWDGRRGSGRLRRDHGRSAARDRTRMR